MQMAKGKKSDPDHGGKGKSLKIRDEDEVGNKRGRVRGDGAVEAIVHPAAGLSRRGVSLAIANAAQTKKKRKIRSESADEDLPGDASSSSPTRPCAWVVAEDSVKGRVLVSSRDIKVGEVVLEDEPLVCASSFEYRWACFIPLAYGRVFPPSLFIAFSRRSGATGPHEDKQAKKRLMVFSWFGRDAAAHAAAAASAGYRCIQCNSAHASSSCAKAKAALPAGLLGKLSVIEREMEELEVCATHTLHTSRSASPSYLPS